MQRTILVSSTLAVIALSLLPGQVRAAEFITEEPRQMVSWALGDPDTDQVEGTRTTRAYAECDIRQPQRLLVVAVIDSGIDIAHPDLKEVIWTNQHEAGGAPGIDDDGNGYIDDIHGWNFIGSRDGNMLVVGTMEVTRQLARLRKLAAAQHASAEQLSELEQMEKLYVESRDEHAASLINIVETKAVLADLLAIMTGLGLSDPNPASIAAFNPGTPSGEVLKQLYLGHAADEPDLAQLRRKFDSERADIDIQFGIDFDESAIIGDDPTKLDELGYGNPFIDRDPRAFHGTHVSGIIAAIRNNAVGIDGHCSWVRIMSLRAVPDGDERDKDVANAIRYAVDNGAKIINMSFGKPISPDKPYVDAAFRHALAHDVLLVLAAGNDAMDRDAKDGHFPSQITHTAEGIEERFANVLIVGASSPKRDRLPASFSNYGQLNVDIFAPGVGVPSTTPGGKVQPASGTSMAAPVVSGVAALVWSQHPELSAVQLRKALMDNARRYPALRVLQPGSRTKRVPFETLSVTGGVVDAWLTLRALHPQARTEAPPATTVVEPVDAEPDNKPKDISPP